MLETEGSTITKQKKVKIRRAIGPGRVRSCVATSRYISTPPLYPPPPGDPGAQCARGDLWARLSPTSPGGGRELLGVILGCRGCLGVVFAMASWACCGLC